MDILLSILSAHRPAELLLISLVFVLAGMVKGVVGPGLPTGAVGLLGMMMDPREAAALLVLPSLVTNAWQLASGPAAGALARWRAACGRCWPGSASAPWPAACYRWMPDLPAPQHRSMLWPRWAAPS